MADFKIPQDFALSLVLLLAILFNVLMVIVISYFIASSFSLIGVKVCFGLIVDGDKQLPLLLHLAS